MSASNSFILRPVLTTVCSLLIVLAGLIALPILPIENLPDIAPPTVKVSARYSGADAISVCTRSSSSAAAFSAPPASRSSAF